MVGHEHESTKEFGIPDAVLLPDTQLQPFTDNLHKRWNKGRIYTYIGEVCVSVNPYRQLAIYEPDVVELYRGREMYERPPHLFAVAEAAHVTLKRTSEQSCILISGESGSGKTEASKHIMRYLAHVTNPSHRADIQRVTEILLKSNCVLEAFGNAQTNRNDNSSRFGKYMAIHFDFKGDPVGGNLTHYLLEKSRVVGFGAGERNFHSFYQLLGMGGVVGKGESLLRSKDPQDYGYLSGSAMGKADAAEGRNVVAAMKALGMDVGAVWETLAGVLHLGNLCLESVNGNEESRVGAAGRADLASAAAQLGLSPAALEEAITSRVIPSRKDAELLRRPLNVTQALTARDALAKAIYERLFAWIVETINDDLKEGATGHGMKNVIGVLDIYGFEIFQANSFEQLCINYANEKLQQQFIQLVLRSEQEEYAREGIEWTPVEYFDNEPICALIERPQSGILAILDEACANVGKVTDEMWLAALNQKLAGSPHFASRATATSDKTMEFARDFRLEHYAGPVTYSVLGFIEKNRDDLFLHLSRLAHSSSHPFLQALFPEGAQAIDTVSKRPPTAGNRFKNSINALIANLATKVPFYVRCIKPNGRKSGEEWDEKLVEHQIAYLGLLENLRVRRAGFAHRMPYTRFLQRYKMLSPRTWPNFRGGSNRDGAEVVLKEQGLWDDVVPGNNKLFIRSPQTIFTLEETRNATIPLIVQYLQKVWVGTNARRRVKKTRAVYRIMDAYRRYKLRSYMLGLIQTFQGVRDRHDLGKSLVWPPAPKVLATFVDKLQVIHRRWRCGIVRGRVPREEWETYSLKLQAVDALQGKRRGDWGFRRPWISDYLAAENKGYHSTLLATHPFQRVLFATQIKKFNHHGKMADRALVITDAFVAKLNSKTLKVMETYPLKELESVWLSEGADNLLVLRFNSYDFICCLTSPGASVGEVVGRLRAEVGSGLSVVVRAEVSVRLGNKSKTLSVFPDPASSSPLFRAHGHDLQLLVPPTSA